MLHMIVEQTKDHPRRMVYDPVTDSFSESDRQSLLYERHFSMPYGWIKESGTPPGKHWDCILMSREDCRLGDEIEVEVIGLFRRADLDHKYLVVRPSRAIRDYAELAEEEKEELRALYPHIREREGWYGREEALCCMANHPPMD